MEQLYLLLYNTLFQSAMQLQVDSSGKGTTRPNHGPGRPARNNQGRPAYGFLQPFPFFSINPNRF
jgi:hypothetical protein